MKNILLFLLSFLCLLFYKEGLAQKSLQGTVKIYAYGEEEELPPQIGTGIIVGRIGVKVYVLTAYHVVENGKRFEAQLYGPRKKTFNAYLYPSFEEELDIAVLTLEGPAAIEIEGYKYRKSNDKKVKSNRSVAVVGNPLEEDFQFNNINITKVSDYPYQLKITNSFIKRGYSGGPILMRKNGRFLGMITELEGNEALGVRANELFWYLDSWEVPYNLVKRPVKTSTYLLGGLSIVSLAVGYDFNRKGIADYDLYELYRDPDALLAKHGKTQQEVLDDARQNYLFRDIAYGVSGAAVLVAVLSETGLLRKWFGPKALDLSGPRYSGGIYPSAGGLQFGIVMNF